MRDPRRPVATPREAILRQVWLPAALVFIALWCMTLFYPISARTIMIYGFITVTSISLVAVDTTARKRGRAIVERADYRICPRSRYRLVGLPDDGSCPECGRAYLHDTLKITWKSAYRIRNPKS